MIHDDHSLCVDRYKLQLVVQNLINIMVTVTRMMGNRAHFGCQMNAASATRERSLGTSAPAAERPRSKKKR